MPDTAYGELASYLRRAIRNDEYSNGRRLPTEAELASSCGVSRQTVRRAMQDLVSEGLIHRIRGKGTFVASNDSRYIRQIGSVEDLMTLSEDTVMTLSAPAERHLNLAAASRLRLHSDVTLEVSFSRTHDGMPISFTKVSMPAAFEEMLNIPEFQEIGRASRQTLLAVLDANLPEPIREADQTISVAPLPEEASQSLALTAGETVLCIDRLYYDMSGTPVALAVTWFHPRHYSYRVRLRRSGT